MSVYQQQWTFFTNHAHILLSLRENPDKPLRVVASEAGITERAVQRIVAELEHDGYLERSREGRRNHYKLHLDKPLRHPMETRRSIREILDLLEA